MAEVQKLTVEQQALAEDNMALVNYVIKRCNITGDYDDNLSAGNYGLVKAAATYNPATGYSFATFAITVIRNELYMNLRKYRKISKETSLDQPIATASDGSELALCDVIPDPSETPLEKLMRLESYDDMHEALSHLRERDRMILCHCYGFYGYPKLTQRQIAEKLEISQSYVSRVIVRSLDRMRSYLVREHKGYE